MSTKRGCASRSRVSYRSHRIMARQPPPPNATFCCRGGSGSVNVENCRAAAVKCNGRFDLRLVTGARHSDRMLAEIAVEPAVVSQTHTVAVSQIDLREDGIIL